MSGFLRFFILMAAALPSSAPRPAPPELHHPIPGHRSMVASFGEYRAAHLHSGIDFSTRGQTGIPVHAVDSGYIYRLKMQWRGYGRAVYLRHSDGRVSVYAHLERFEEKNLGLESRVAEEQKRIGGRYPGDIYLTPPVPVAGGAVVGFSGESGAGLPHLHFEMRREEDRPADPFVKGWVEDGSARPPVFEGLVWVAAAEETWFEDERQIEVPLQLDGKGRYVPTRPLTVTGPFIPLALVYAEGGRGHRLGLRGLTTRVDGRDVYRFELHDFRFTDFPKVGVLMSHAQSRLSPTRYAYYLQRMPGNDLGKAGPEKPWPVLSAGAHLLEVEAISPVGKISRAHIPFEVLSPVRPHWSIPPGPGKSGRLSWGDRREVPDERLEVRYSPLGKKGSLTCNNPIHHPDGEECFFLLGPTDRGITARVYRGAHLVGAATHVLSTGEAMDPPEDFLDLIPFGEFLELQAPTTPGLLLPAQVRVGTQASIQVRPFREMAPGRLVATLSRKDWVGRTSLEISGIGRGAPPVSPLQNRVVLADPSSTALLDGCGPELRLPLGALFDTTFLACQEVPEKASPPPGLIRVSPVVSFRPAGLPLAKKSILRYHRPGLSGDGKVGIYRFDSPGERWRYLGREAENGALSAQISRLETFALIRDDSPPEILRVDSVSRSSASSAPMQIRVRVKEEGAGLSYDGVHLRISGLELETEYDPDRGWATTLPGADLPSGRRPGEAWAVDLAGNRSETLAFSITIR